MNAKKYFSRMIIPVAMMLIIALTGTLKLTAQTGDASITGFTSTTNCVNTPDTLRATFHTDSAATNAVITASINGFVIFSAPTGVLTANLTLQLSNVYSFTKPGKNIVKAWVSGTSYTDINHANDTATLSLNIQFSGTYTVGSLLTNTFTSLKQAVDSINVYGICGPTVINFEAGHTETNCNIVLNTTTTNATNTLIFNGNGAVITAGTGANTYDGILKIAGTDYVTFTHFTLLESAGNNTTATQMEWGIALVRASATNGTQYCTISNCNITLNRTNAASIGIYSASRDANNTPMTISSVTGINRNNKIYSNTIQNCYVGINLSGFSSASPYALYDQNNEIGVSSGNIISNFGGGSTASPRGIIILYQNNVKVAKNTITGGNGTTGQIVYGIFSSTNNESNIDIYENDISISSGATTQALYGIQAGSGSSGTTNTINIRKNIIHNCTYPSATTAAFYGIQNIANSLFALNIDSNYVYNDSLAGSGAMIGIDGGTATTINITNNKIYNLYRTAVAGANPLTGIKSSLGTVTISGNQIFNLSSFSAATAPVYGINPTTGTSYIFNNFISELKAPAATTITAPITLVNGIFVTGGTASNIYFNTIFLNASSTGANFGSSGIYANTTPTVELKNNIVVNNSTPSGIGMTVAYRRSSATLTTFSAASNKNLYYIGVPGATRLVFHDGTNAKDSINKYIAFVSPSDGQAFSEMPPFTNTTTPPYNLHMLTTVSTQCEGNALPVTTPPITNDIDKEARNATTPDVGADEGNFMPLDQTGPSIIYTPLANALNNSARTLTATITDPSGVRKSGTGRPVLYWRRNTGSYTAVPGTYIGSNQFRFTFGTGIVPFDSVMYYVAAQDSLSIPNVSVFPAGGASGFTINPPAASTPPTTPSKYYYNVVTSYPYTQDFEVSVPPSYWNEIVIVPGTTAPDWSRVTAGTNPTASPLANLSMAQFNSDVATAGSRARLITPGFYLTGITNPQMTFNMYHDNLSTLGDSLTIEISTDGSSWTRVSNYLRYAATTGWTTEAYVINLAPYANQTVFISFTGTSRAGNNIYIDYVTVESGPTCPAPSNLSASGVTQNSAVLSWTSGGSARWNIEYGLASTYTGPGTGTGTLVQNITSNPYTLNGLASSSTFKFYVQDSCGIGDVSAWAGPYTFSTTCGVVSNYPYTQSFNATLPNCWSFSEDVTGATYHWAPTTADATHGAGAPRSGTHFMYLYVYLASATYNSYYLTTESFNLGTSVKQLTYSYYLGSSGYTTAPVPLEVLISTNGGSTWISLYQHTSANSTFQTGSSGWAENTINLSAYSGSTVTFRFKSNSNYGSGYCDQAIDEVTVENVPTCLKPTSLTAISGATQAMLSWTPGQSETQWQVEYTTGINTVRFFTNHRPDTLRNLTSSTSYTYRLRAICGANDTSTWTSSFAFATLCDAFTLPFTESFDGTTFAPNCWMNKKIAGPGTYLWARSTAGTYPTCTPHTGLGMAYFNSYSSSGQRVKLITPPIAFGGSLYQVKLWMYRDDGYLTYADRVNVYYNTDTSHTTANLLGTINRSINMTPVVAANGWYEYSFNIPASAANQIGYILFEGWSLAGNNIFVDDIMINEQPPCSNPSGLTASNISTNSATVKWIAANGATYYNIKWKAAPYLDSTIIRHVTDTFKVLNGLVPSTNYKFWVQDSCALTGTLNGWVGPYTFATACAAVSSYPWTENFDGLTTPALPICWSQNDANADGDKWITYTTYGTGGTQCAGIYTDYNAGANNDYLILPQMTLTGNQQLLFSVRAMTTSEPNDYEVVLSTAGNTPAEFTNVLQSLTTVSNTTQTQIAVPINLSAYSGNVWIAIHVPAGGLDGWYLYVDDVLIENIPTCLKPTALSAATGTTQAVLSWMPGQSESQWQVEYTTGINSTRYFTNHYPDTLRNLTSSTSYTYRLRAICGANDTSTWTNTFAFNTTMIPLTLPYALNFETGTGTWQIANSGQTNIWYNGGATGYNSDSSLYITNDNGVSNAYNITSLSVVHFYHDVLFTSGFAEYKLDFDWLANGESTYDYLRVYLADPSVTPIAGTLLTTGLIGATEYDLQTTWQHASISLPGTLAGAIKRLVFSWRNDGSLGTQPPAAIDNISVVPVTCGLPYSLTAMNITTTSAHLGWVSQTGVTQWEVEYGIGNFTFGTGTRYFTTTNPDTLENLSSATTYNFYIRAVCSPGDTSQWAGPSAFTTACDSYGLPFTESFDGTTFAPDCWMNKKIAGGGTYLWAQSTAGVNPTCSPHTGIGMAYFNSYSTSGQRVKLVTPPLSFGGSRYQVKFWMYRDNGYLTYADRVNVYYNTDTSHTTATLLGTINRSVDMSPVIAANGWYEYTFYLPPGAANQLGYILFEGWSLAGNNIFVDDITVEEQPACANPSGLTASYITTTSATLNWFAGNGATYYNIKWQVSPYTDSTIIRNVTDTSFVLNGLASSTEYKYWVQDSCAINGQLLNWTGPYTFYTACGSFIIPYSQNFDGVTAPAIPQCMLVTNDNSDNILWTTYTTNPNTSPNCISIGYHSTNALDDWFFSPGLNLRSGITYTLKFNYRGGSTSYTEKLEVKIGSGQSAASMTGGTIYTNETIQNITYSLAQVTFTVPANGIYYFGWHGYSIANQLRIYVDDIVVETCSSPAAFAASNITTNSVDLSWISSASEWQVKYTISGITQITNAATNPFTLSNLNPASTYSIQVRSICNSGDTSSWSSPIIVNTSCIAVAATYSQNFDIVTTPNLPNCWSKIVITNNTYASVTTISGTNAYSSPNCIQLYNSSSTNLPNHKIMLISPELSDLTSQTNQLRFMAKRGATNENLIIGTMGNPADTSTFTPFSTINPTTTYAEYTIPFNHYSGSDHYIAFRQRNLATYTYIYIDNVFWEPLPSCPKPVNLTAVNITSTSADFSWTAGGSESQWQIQYTTGANTTLLFTNDNPSSLSSLTPSSVYTFKVRAVCGAGDTSQWSDSFVFNTLCEAFEATFTQNFDAVTTPNLPLCWSKIGYHPLSTFATVTSITTTTPFSAPNHVQLYNSSSTLNAATRVMLITPELNDLSTGLNQIRFMAKTTANAERLIVGTMTDPLDTAAFTPFSTISTLTTTYQEFTIPFNTYTGMDRYIAFKHGNTAATRYIYLDDITWERIPSCPKPTSSNVSPGASQAVLSWTAGGNETQWQIAYTMGTNTVTFYTNYRPDTLRNLIPTTSYTVRIRAVCGIGDTSLWTNNLAFTTLCNPVVTFPWTENFDAINTPTLPSCWYKENGDWITTTNSYSSYDADAHSGTQFLRESYSATNEYIWTPPFNLIAGIPYDFSFWWAGDGYSNWTGDVFVNNTQSSIGATQIGGPFITSAITTTLTYEQITYNFIPPSSGIYSFAIRVNCPSSAPWYLSFDDFRLDVTPPCSPPHALNASNISTNSATISWTPGTDATYFNVKYKAAPFTDSIMVTHLTDTFKILSGLSPSTQYKFWVQDSCSATSSLTGWIGPFIFTTSCSSTMNLPYSQSFEGGTNLPVCWSENIVTTGSTAPAWTIVSAGLHPTTCMPVGGSNMARFNSYSATSGAASRLESGILDMSGVHQAKFSFFMYHDPAYTATTDSLAVQIYDGTSWMTLGGYLRYDDTAQWKHYEYNISTYLNANMKIGFLGISDYGNDIYVDSVYMYCVPDSAFLTVTPGCITGSVTVHSTYNGNQTFYLRNATGNPVNEWTGNDIMHAFTGLNSAGYTGQVGSVTCISNLSAAVALNNSNPPLVYYVPPQSQDSVCVNAVPFTLLGGYGNPAGGTGVYSGTGVNNNMFTPSIAGLGQHHITFTYTVNGCSNDTFAVITVHDCLQEINDLDNITVKIYPNPTDGKIFIEISELPSNAQLNIFNIQGQVMYNLKLAATNKEFRKELDMNTYPKGIYFIKLVSDRIMKVYKVVLN